MYVNIKAFWLPKEGFKKKEYEDSFWFEPQRSTFIHRKKSRQILAWEMIREDHLQKLNKIHSEKEQSILALST